MTKISLNNQILTINDFNEKLTNENKYISDKSKNEYYNLKYYLKKNNIDNNDIKLIDTIIFNDCNDKNIYINKEFINLQKIIKNNCSNKTMSCGNYIKKYYNNDFKKKGMFSCDYLKMNNIKSDNDILTFEKCKNMFLNNSNNLNLLKFIKCVNVNLNNINNIKTLIIKNCNYVNLNNINNLEKLIIDNNKNCFIDGLNNLTYLKNLEIQNNNINLKYFINLEKLKITNTNIIIPKILINLKELEIDNCKIYNIDNLKNYINLENLNIKNCETINYIPYIKKLKKLNLYNNIKLQFINKHLYNLEELEVNNCDIRSIPYLKKLNYININNNKDYKNIELKNNIEIKKYLKNKIKNITLDNKNINEILNNKKYYNMKMIKILILRDINNINDDIFLNFKNIKTLEIYNCDLKELSINLIKLKNLKIIKCKNLLSIPNTFINLKSIYLKDCNNIFEIPNNLINLKNLYLIECDNIKSLSKFLQNNLKILEIKSEKNNIDININYKVINNFFV